MLDRFTAITGALLMLALLGCFAWGARWRSAALDAEALHATAEARRRMCAESVEALAQEAKARAAESAKALEQAQVRARTLAQRADAQLRRPAAVPGDDCASARARARAWLEARQ